MTDKHYSRQALESLEAGEKAAIYLAHHPEITEHAIKAKEAIEELCAFLQDWENEGGAK